MSATCTKGWVWLLWSRNCGKAAVKSLLLPKDAFLR